MDYQRYATIAFPERFPRFSGSFDYAVPQSLLPAIAPGTAVTVKFRGRLKIGVVISINDTTKVPKEKIALIEGLYEINPLCSKKQIELLQWLVSETQSSPSTIIRSLLPQKPVRQQYAPAEEGHTGRQPHSRPTTHVFSRSSDEDSFICEQTKNGLHVIACPDIATVDHLRSILANNRQELLVIVGKEHMGKKFSQWLRARKMKQGILLGTRSVLLMPFQRPHSIFCVHEEDATHSREEQQPDVDTRKLAGKIASLYSSTLVFTSFSVSCGTYLAIQNGTFQRVDHRSIHEPSLKIVDANIFVQKGQSRFLSDDMLAFFSSRKGAHVLLYNRKGLSQMIRCKDCSWEYLCSHCGSHAVVQRQQGHEAACSVCGNISQIPNACPHCGGARIQGRVVGISSLAHDLRRLLPSYRIIEVTKESENSIPEDTDIIIGTFFLIPRLNWKRIASFTILDANALLQNPDYRSSEHALHLLTYIKAHAPEQARITCITSEPNHPLLLALSKNSLAHWYEQELGMRQKLGFPPFGVMFSIQATFASENNRAAAARKLEDSLRHLFSSSACPCRLIQSSSPLPSTSEKGFTSRYIIKCAGQPTPSCKESVYRIVTRPWVILRNPLDL